MNTSIYVVEEWDSRDGPTRMFLFDTETEALAFANRMRNLPVNWRLDYFMERKPLFTHCADALNAAAGISTS